MLKRDEILHDKTLRWLKIKLDDIIEGFNGLDNDALIKVNPKIDDKTLFIHIPGVGNIDLINVLAKGSEEITMDSIDTLKLGLKAEQDTIVEYTKYMNMAGQDTAEAKLWAHIIKDEEEHVKEFENAIKGDFTLIQDASPEKVSNFKDDINDVLQDYNIKNYKIEEEDPHYYIEFKDHRKDAEKAFKVLSDELFMVDFIEDEDTYSIHVLRR